MAEEPSTKLDPRQFSELYTEFISNIPLLPEDRQALKDKRGFSDGTIEKLSFRSTGAAAEAAIRDMAGKRGIENLRQAGLWFGSVPNRKFTDPGNVIIPYLEGEKVIYAKPHKNAPKGLRIPLYLPAPLSASTVCILAESEFKSAAAWQLGYPAIGLSGISAAARANYPPLVDLLKTAGVTVLVVMFDNEEKGNPAYPNYKRYFWDRYDTQFFAYYMARKLGYDGIQASIAVLPDEWRVDGKIDIDGALAMGKTKADFTAVIAERLDPETFLKYQDRDVGILIRRRWQKMFVPSPARIEHGHYVVPKGDPPIDMPVSNFTFTINNNIFDHEGACTREITLKSDVGDIASHQRFTGEQVSNFAAFRGHVASRGDFRFWGTQKDLEMIVALESAREIGKKTIQPDHVGWVSGAKLFLFENGALDDRGNRIDVDEEGIVWRGLTGWQARHISQGSAEGKSELPHLAPDDMDPGQLIDMIEANFGGDPEIRLACAWLIASLVSHWVCTTYEPAFPILFVQGQARAGKSTLCRWLCAMAGRRTEGENYPSNSLVGMQRALSYYSSLPCWFDEFRNSIKHADKEGMLRSAYDGQGALKGIRASFGLRGITIRGKVIVSGQDTPNDLAFQQRCVTVRIKEGKRSASMETYNKLNALAPAMSGIIPVVFRRFRDNPKRVLDAIQTARQVLRDAKLDDRTAITYSIPLGVYDAVVREDHASFLRFVAGHAKGAFAAKESEKPTEIFLADCMTMLSRGIVNGNAVRGVGGQLAIAIGPVFTAWREMIKRGGGEFGFKQVTLLDEMEDHPAFVDRRRSVRMMGKSQRCLILDPTKHEQVMDLYESVVGEDQP